MKWNCRAVLIFAVTLAAAVELPAQRLPQGQYHADRERDFDILHYKAQVSFDFEKREVFGKSTIQLTPLHSLDSVSLDAIHLNVSEVTDARDGSKLTFQVKPRSLLVSLPREEGPQDTLMLAVRYDCTPKAGIYFDPDRKRTDLYFVSTYGENGLLANWLPIYNDVNDKFSSEMIVTVPAPYVVVSNGKLLSTSPQADGQTTYHWLQKLPHSNYLMTLYVGDFEKGELKPAFGTIPIDYWVPRGRLKEGAYVFRNTTGMVEFFSDRFNYRYPWDKYDQVAVPDYAIGAMEHTGATGHHASVLRDKSAPLEFGPALFSYADDWNAESTISHELAHHWFGDNLTCRNLSYIWLNESFASYLMMLWDEESLGKDQLLFDVQLARRHYLEYVAGTHTIRPLEYHHFDDANTIYTTQITYLKGAAVLHMLRNVLGDEEFFRALSYYLHTHEFSNVVSNDLKIAIEESTGRNLGWFFDQWVTGGGRPEFEVGYRYLERRKLIELSVRQVQSIVEGQGLFTLPVAITVATPSKTWEEKVWVKHENEQYLLPCEEKPLMVSFDGRGDLVAEVHFPKEVDELAYQAEHDAVPGALRAIRELASRYPTSPKTTRVLSNLLSGDTFWGVQAEAAYQLGTVRTRQAEELVPLALKSGDYRVRKAAVLALPRFGTPSAVATLRNVIDKDPQSDVVATAIIALAKADPDLDPAFIRKQLARPSWYDEIKVGCMYAFRELENAAAVAAIKPYTSHAYNQDVRQAALQAWEACEPADKELEDTLLSLTQSPVYTLQQLAINMLGRLHVSRARDVLEQIVAEDADANLTVAAKNALREIGRVDQKTD